MGPPAGGAVLCLSLPVLEAVGEGRSSQRGCSATTEAVMAGEFSGSARRTWITDYALAKLKLSARAMTTLMTLTYLRAAAGWSTPWNSPKREEKRDPIQEEEEVGEVLPQEDGEEEEGLLVQLLALVQGRLQDLGALGGDEDTL